MNAPRPPLDGVRILAVSQFGAGPFGTMALADMGADVIKIEDPESGGDVARYVPPDAADGDSLYFQAFNRGKRSVALNLRHPKGRAVLRDLARRSDALFNNLRGDLPGKLGLTYDALKELNPAIVCCSLSGFGLTGPRMAEPGYDPLMQAYAGYMAMTGEPGGPPTRSAISFVDFAGGYVAALAVMVGLYDARRTGRGRDLDVSLLDTALAMLAHQAVWALNSEWTPRRAGRSAHQSIVPAQIFRTRDGWISIFCAKDKFFRALAVALGHEELPDDPRFDSFSARLENREELNELVETTLMERTTADWLKAMRGRVPCAPVNTLHEALEDEQVRARGTIVAVEHPRFGRLAQVGSPIRTEGTGGDSSAGPALGQHTTEVLQGLLGYSPERVRSLRESGAVA